MFTENPADPKALGRLLCRCSARKWQSADNWPFAWHTDECPARVLKGTTGTRMLFTLYCNRDGSAIIPIFREYEGS